MDFLQTQGTGFTLGGEPVRYSGTNCYYLPHASHQTVDMLLDSADALRLRLIRTIAYFEEERNNEAFQQRLDYVVAGAAKRGLRLLLPLTNNWKDFGGIPAYVAHHGLASHDDFYEDARTRQAYKDWCRTLLDRVNPLTNIAYKDDPTIVGWELCNEARCVDKGIPPLRRWIEEMSEYVKSIDSKHLVGLGDEGFYNRWSTRWWMNGSQGYDFDEFLQIPSIDFGSFHLYPDALGVEPGYGNRWIEEHCESGDKAQKPVILEEYGIKDPAARNDVYAEWLATARKHRVASDLFWMLADKRDDGTLYPDYDGYTIYPDSLPQAIRDHLLVA